MGIPLIVFQDLEAGEGSYLKKKNAAALKRHNFDLFIYLLFRGLTENFTVEYSDRIEIYNHAKVLGNPKRQGFLNSVF